MPDESTHIPIAQGLGGQQRWSRRSREGTLSVPGLFGSLFRKRQAAHPKISAIFSVPACWLWDVLL